MIPQDAVDCPYCEKNTIKTTDQKPCPFCGEVIRGKAVKCKHCGEFVDGRRREESAQQVIYIDKAVITGRDEDGNLEVEGPEPGQITAGSAGPETLLEGEERQALPPGAGEEKRKAGLPARTEKAPVPEKVKAAAGPPAEAPPKEAEEAGEEAPTEPPPPVRYECPSCGRYVYEDDNFCENCGRDLSIPAGEKELKGPGQRYQPADYALMIAAAAPAGLLFRPAAALGIAAVGGALAGWSLYRTLSSKGQLRGAGAAGGGLGAAGFWALMVAVLA